MKETVRTRSQTIRAKLLSWFEAEKRELPWRGITDPYRIWVSEVMLQQTTVAAVRGRYESFLDRFPDVRALAGASRDGVLAEWSGLGYYARARNLHAAAEILVRDHGGRLPEDPAILRGLPGFGEYMSAAVPSLAYGVRAPAADANVERVLSRLFLIRGRAGTRDHRRRVLEAMERLLPEDRPGDAIAALMDLGQAICVPRRPRCQKCPLRRDCAALRSGEQESLPEKAPRKAYTRVAIAAADARRGGRALMVRHETDWLRGLWGFPFAEGATPAIARRRLADRARELGLRLDLSAPTAAAYHTVMRRRLQIEIIPAAPAGDRGFGASRTLDADARWFTPEELAHAAIPTLTRKIAAAGRFLPRGDRPYPVET